MFGRFDLAALCSCHTLNVCYVMLCLMPVPCRALQLLIMSVACGFGGQSFQEQVLGKVAVLRKAFPQLNIQVSKL